MAREVEQLKKDSSYRNLMVSNFKRKEDLTASDLVSELKLFVEYLNRAYEINKANPRGNKINFNDRALSEMLYKLHIFEINLMALLGDIEDKNDEEIDEIQWQFISNKSNFLTEAFLINDSIIKLKTPLTFKSSKEKSNEMYTKVLAIHCANAIKILQMKEGKSLDTIFKSSFGDKKIERLYYAIVRKVCNKRSPRQVPDPDNIANQNILNSLSDELGFSDHSKRLNYMNFTYSVSDYELEGTDIYIFLSNKILDFFKLVDKEYELFSVVDNS